MKRIPAIFALIVCFCVAASGENMIPYIKTEKYFWQKSEAGAMNWSQAMRACDNLKLGGYSDWRLPSKIELLELYKNRGILRSYFLVLYWSSSTHKDKMDLAWYVYFRNGFEHSTFKSAILNVRCLRDR